MFETLKFVHGNEFTICLIKTSHICIIELHSQSYDGYGPHEIIMTKSLSNGHMATTNYNKIYC
jgi:hypothetical protein